MTSRRIFRISGSDRLDFLQGLITNDIRKLDQGLVYTALLTPQGKYIADFFLASEGEAILLDVAEPLADDLAKRLNMYRLRADVKIEDTDLNLQRGSSAAPDGALSDPRHEALGWRAYTPAPASDDGTDWDAIRVAHCVPESGVELSSDSFILEAGFDRLNGVDFRKGCFVGQEVTARMRHRTELLKGLARVRVEGSAPVGTPITADDKPAGTLFTQADGRGIAYLRFNRAKGEMRAGDATLRLD